jgi:polar amino acid transport system substrate-binding protein
MHSWRKWGVALAVVAGSAAIAACGSSSSSPTTTSAATGTGTTASAGSVASVVKLVPAPIKSKGTITVAADASYAPDEYFAPDGHTVIGMDPDLVKALAAVMGLKANVVNATFDSIIPGLAASKYDMGASSFTDTKEREKTVDFVDYANVGESFYTKTSGGTDITGIEDICGKSVAVEKGTTEQTDAQTQSTKCTKAGKPAVKVLVFPDQNGANLAVSSGRAQLGFADQPVAAYQVKKTGGQFKLVGAAFATAPYGLAIPKSSHFAPAVLAALKEIMSNGTYSSVLNHWGLQQVAISPSAVKIDGATS